MGCRALEYGTILVLCCAVIAFTPAALWCTEKFVGQGTPSVSYYDSKVVAALAVVGRPVTATNHNTSSPMTFYRRDAGLMEYISRYYSSRHGSALASETSF